MEIRFRDLHRQYNKYKDEIDYAMHSVANQGDFILGNDVKLFEKELSEYVGVKHVISCANGTDAMTLVLMAWDIGENDAVFVPSFTFFATAEVVTLRGATPIFVDVDKSTFNLSALSLIEAINYAKKINLRPKVIIPVDLFGLPANYEEIESIAKEYGLLILEDSAQGFGGSIKGKLNCSFGHAATTSFYPAKPLGCYGDGGAIFTNDDDLATQLFSLRAHGVGSHRYDNVRIGLNSRLDTLQAAILRVKLKAFISHELSDVNSVARTYDEKLIDHVCIPSIPSGYVSSYAQYTIILANLSEREFVIKSLAEVEIPTMIYYPKPLHLQKAFDYLDEQDNCLYNSEELSNQVLSLPIHPYMKMDEIEYVSNVLINAVSKFRSQQG